MKYYFGFILCAIGVILPWRLRIIYSEILGWIAQIPYLLYYLTLRFILRLLSEKKDTKYE